MGDDQNPSNPAPYSPTWGTDPNARRKALATSSGAFPGAADDMTANLAASRAMGIQRAVAGAPMSGGSTTAASLGSAAATGASKDALDATKYVAGAQQQNAATAISSASTDASLRAASGSRDVSSAQASADQAADVLGQGLKDKLVTQQLKFSEDERGRTLFNARQLADFAVTKATNGEQLKDYAQSLQQATDEKVAVLNAAFAKIKEAEEFEQKKRTAEVDYNRLKDLAQKKADIQRAIDEAKADAANNVAMFQTGGAVVGGVIGGIYGGPMGAAAGASIGGGLGTAVGGQYNSATGAGTPAPTSSEG